MYEPAHHIFSKRCLSLLFAVVLATACGDATEVETEERDASFLVDGKSDAFGVYESSPDACAVLRLVNESNRDELRMVANPASLYITQYRAGADETLFTADDNIIRSLIELDDIPYVGPSAFGKLLVYARANYACAAPPPAPAADCAVLRAANEATVEQLDVDAKLDRRAAEGIVAARPIATIADLDAVSYVGASTIAALGDFATAEGYACDVECSATGGTYDGVAFTRDEECHVVDFMNNARLSQMGTLSAALRSRVYDCAELRGRLDCTDGRLRTWSSLALLDPFLGGTSMRQLATAGASWVDDGRNTDTVASVWRDRASLVGAPIGFDNVIVTRRIPSSSTTRFCYEIRDELGAPNYLRACVGTSYGDDSTACDGQRCLDNWLERHVAFRGTLKTDSSGPYVQLPLTVAPRVPVR